MSDITSVINNILPKIQKELLSFRIDAKIYDAQNGTITVEGENLKISYPEWFKNERGQGVLIEGDTCERELVMGISQAGRLKIDFRGKDKRINGKRFPLKICYTSLKIDGEEILTKPVTAWHDEPFKYEKSVKEGDKIVLNLKICPYSYDKTELKEFILSQPIYSCDEIISNIDKIVDRITADNLLKQNQLLTQYCDALENRLNKFELLLNSMLPNENKSGSIYTKQVNDNDILKEVHNNLWVLKDLVMKKSGDEKIRYERVYNELCNSKGCWIGSGSKWATIPTLPHGFHGIFVSGGAKIGKRCVIYQNVTIGSNTTKGSSKNGSPEIGDNVLIGAGATIIGKIRIGNNVRIGAGCAVAIDVPDDSVVVSQKPVIIHKENMDNRFYHYENGKYGYVEDGIFHPVDGE